MERKQGFFSALKEEVIRGLSPGRSRANSPSTSASPVSSLLRRRKGRRNLQKEPEPLIIARSGSLRSMEALSPLREGPDQDDGEDSRMEGSWGHWMKGQLSRTPSVSSSNMFKRSDLRLLLGVLGAPLAPVHVSCAETSPHLSIKDNPIVSPFHHLLIVLHFMGYLVKCNAKFLRISCFRYTLICFLIFFFSGFILSFNLISFIS